MTDCKEPGFNIGDEVYSYLVDDFLDIVPVNFTIARISIFGNIIRYFNQHHIWGYDEEKCFPTFETLKAHLHAQIDALEEPKES